MTKPVRSVLYFNPDSGARARSKRQRQGKEQQRISRQPFLAYEDTILRRYYPDEGVMGVSRRLDRSQLVIAKRVRELGLERRPEVSRWSMPESCVGWMTGWLGRRFA